MTVPSDFEIVPASDVGDRKRWWCESHQEAEALVSGAGSLLTLADLHDWPPPTGKPWAIVQRSAAPSKDGAQ